MTVEERYAELERIIIHEYWGALAGDAYIESVTDARRFVGHLIHVITDGRQGELRPCLQKGTSP